jgi:hypothetical protein
VAGREFVNKRQRKKSFKKLYGVAPELIWRRAFDAYLKGVQQSRGALAAGVQAGAEMMMRSLVHSVASALVHRAVDDLLVHLPARADDEMRPEYDLRGGVRGKYYYKPPLNPARPPVNKPERLTSPLE